MILRKHLQIRMTRNLQIKTRKIQIKRNLIRKILKTKKNPNQRRIRKQILKISLEVIKMQTRIQTKTVLHPKILRSQAIVPSLQQVLNQARMKVLRKINRVITRSPQDQREVLLAKMTSLARQSMNMSRFLL